MMLEFRTLWRAQEMFKVKALACGHVNQGMKAGYFRRRSFVHAQLLLWEVTCFCRLWCG